MPNPIREVAEGAFDALYPFCSARPELDAGIEEQEAAWHSLHTIFDALLAVVEAPDPEPPDGEWTTNDAGMPDFVYIDTPEHHGWEVRQAAKASLESIVEGSRE